jgi:FAD/FMN-containing dehydrogenase
MELVGFGPPEEHDAALGRIRAVLPPAWELVESVPYAGLQSMFDDENPNGQYAHDRNAYLDDLSDGAIAALVEHVPLARSPESGVVLYRMDGAYSDVPDEATAFGGLRRPGYGVFVVAACATPEVLADDRAWVRALSDALRPHARAGAYVNATADSAPSQVQASYGPEKWPRLREIKTRVDPANVFHRNQNIPPLP